MWSIYNLGNNLRAPTSDDLHTRYLRSGVFLTQDGSAWMLELRPRHVHEFQAKLVIHAIPNPRETKASSLTRKLHYTVTIHRPNSPNGQNFDKGSETAYFTWSGDGQPEHESQFLFTVKNGAVSFNNSAAQHNGFLDNLNIELNLAPQVFLESDSDRAKGFRPGPKRLN